MENNNKMDGDMVLFQSKKRMVKIGWENVEDQRPKSKWTNHPTTISTVISPKQIHFVRNQ